MILNYDYGLWKSLKHGVLEMDLEKDMNMKEMIRKMILRINDRLFEYKKLVLILG